MDLGVHGFHSKYLKGLHVAGNASLARYTSATGRNEFAKAMVGISKFELFSELKNSAAAFLLIDESTDMDGHKKAFGNICQMFEPHWIG